MRAAGFCERIASISRTAQGCHSAIVTRPHPSGSSGKGSCGSLKMS